MLKDTPRYRLEFNLDNMTTFIQHYFKEDNASQDQVESLLKDNINLRELCVCPLFLGMICFLVKDWPERTREALQDKYITSTTIYFQFINKLMMSHLQSKANDTSSEPVDEKQFEHEFMNEEQPNVGQIAVFLLRNRQNTRFTLSDLRDEFNEQYNEYRDLCVKLQELGLLVKMDTYYEFFHLSVVEFLSAWHIVRHLSEFIPNREFKFPITANIRCFIVGLISLLRIELNDETLRGIICGDPNDDFIFYELIYETLSNRDLFIQCCKVIEGHINTVMQHYHVSDLDDDPLNEYVINFRETFFNSNASVIAYTKLWNKICLTTNAVREISPFQFEYGFCSENISAESFSELGNLMELLNHGTLCTQNSASTCDKNTCTWEIRLMFYTKTDQRVVELLFGLKPRFGCLKEFWLNGYELKDSAEVKCLVDYLPMKVLTSLRLYNCGNLLLKNTPNGDVSPFVKELKESSTISTLSLTYNSFGLDDMGSLSTALQNKPNLINLNLSGNQLGLVNDADVKLFTSALNGMDKLTHLDLKKCNLTDEGIVPVLSQAILNGQLPSIIIINLRDNLINKEAVILVKALLELNMTIRPKLWKGRQAKAKLELSKTNPPIDDENVGKCFGILLEAIIRLNEPWVRLFLKGNPIDDETLDEIADMIIETLPQRVCSTIACSGLPTPLSFSDDFTGNQYNFMYWLFAEGDMLTWSTSMKNSCKRRMKKMEQTHWESSV